MNELTRQYFNYVHTQRELLRVDELIRKCESPIEELFVIAFYSCRATKYIEGVLRHSTGQRLDVVTLTQANIGKYRVDFVLSVECDEERSIYVIELDGHVFHERTKEQVIKANERDRFFTGKGIKVIHFSGSEVYNDPDGCVKKAIECIIDCELVKREKE